MPTWEYLVTNQDIDLALLGRQGWELVGVGRDTSGDRLYFKRPTPTFRDRVTLEQKRHAYTSLGVPLPEEAE